MLPPDAAASWTLPCSTPKDVIPPPTCVSSRFPLPHDSFLSCHHPTCRPALPPPPTPHAQSLTIEEVKARQERLAKMRLLLFHHELKAKRLKEIKSKDYRKRVAKVRLSDALSVSLLVSIAPCPK